MSSLRSVLIRMRAAFSANVTVFTFANDLLTLTHGKASQGTTRALQALLRDHQCTSGTIALRKNGRITITGDIPGALHQRIRNLLASQ